MPANAFLVRWSKGWREVKDQALIDAGLRQEALLGLGAAQSEGEVDRIARKQIELFGTPREEIAIDLDPSSDADTPYLGFRIGDTVTIPAQDLTPTQERCMAITVTEDDDGNVSYAVEFADIILDDQQLFMQTIKSMADGTVSGQSRAATPVAYVQSTSPGADCCPPSVPPGGG